MDIRPISPLTGVSSTEADVPRRQTEAKTPVPHEALDPQVLAAAQASLPAGLELQAGLDPDEHRVVVKLVDRETGQLLYRFPAEQLQDPRWFSRMTGRLINILE